MANISLPRRFQNKGHILHCCQVCGNFEDITVVPFAWRGLGDQLNVAMGSAFKTVVCGNCAQELVAAVGVRLNEMLKRGMRHSQPKEDKEEDEANAPD